MLLICGIFMSSLEGGFEIFKRVDKHGLLAIFVPIVIFEPALNANYHYFIKILGQVTILSVPVFVVTAAICTLVFQWLVYVPNWHGATILGILVSITDPVDVIIRLNQKRADHKFITLFELEALSNDATGIIFFNFFSKLAVEHHPAELSFNFFLMDLVVALFGGIAMGWLFKYLC